MKLREEEPADKGAIDEVHEAAFGPSGRMVARLVDDLRRTVPPHERLSLVAEQGDRIVGHVMFTRSLLDAPVRLVSVQVLSPLGVHPDSQRQGVGTSLTNRGLKLLADRDVPAVFLEGDPKYYSRFGFVPASACGYRKPSLRIPDHAFLVLRLPSNEPWMTGTLVYSDAFWRQDAVGLRDASPRAGS